MRDIAAEIETLEHRFMRGWMRGDKAELKRIILRDFIWIFGAAQPEILDRPSFLAACDNRLTCTGYRLHEVVARKHGKSVWFAAGIDLEMRVGGQHWSGEFWLTDLWCKTGFRRDWKLAERSLSRTGDDAALMPGIRDLQLWT